MKYRITYLKIYQNDIIDYLHANAIVSEQRRTVRSTALGVALVYQDVLIFATEESKNLFFLLFSEKLLHYRTYEDINYE